MAKYVQPNFIVDSSAAFLRNVSFDSSIYLKGRAHISSPATAGVGTPYALTVDSIGANVQIKSKQLGTMAFETSTNYYGKSKIDDLKVQIDASIIRIDASLNDTIDALTLFPTIAYVDGSLNAKLNKAGDTMTGLLTLSGSGVRLDSVTITNIDTSAEGMGSGLDSHIPTSAAVKSAIDAAIASGVTADNGLIENPNGNIQLGGPLTRDTSINLNGFQLYFTSLGTGTTLNALVQEGDAIRQQQLGTMALGASANYYTKASIDSSFASAWTKFGNVDTSLNNIWTKFTQVDNSLNASGAKDAAQDASIVNLRTKDGNIDTSLNNIWTKLGSVDTSLLNLGMKDAALDASIVNINTYQGIQDSSIATALSGTTKAWNGLTRTDNSIGLGGTLLLATTITADPTNTLSLAGLQTSVSNTPYAVVEDSVGGALKLRQLGSMAWETSTNYVGLSYLNASLGTVWSKFTNVDTSLNNLGIKNAAQDVSLNDIWTKFGYVDSSMATMNLWNVNQDSSIASISAAQGNYVLKSGDTMTGPLTINSAGGLVVNGDVSIASGHDLYVGRHAHIGGNLTVDGSVLITNIATLNVSSGFIILNDGLVGAPPPTLQSGIVVNRGSANPYVFVYDENMQTFRIGISHLETSTHYSDSSTQAVATREDAPVSYGVPYWNGSKFWFETSIGFTFTPNVGLNLPIATNDAAATAALFTVGGLVKSRTLGSMAFEASTNYATKGMLDASLVVIWNEITVIEASIGDIRTYLTDLSTNKISGVASTTGVTGTSYSIYSGTGANHVAYIKKLKAGAGTTISEDSSVITIAVGGTTGVQKYRGTFDGTAASPFGILATEHGLGTGPFVISVYESGSQVYTGVDVNGSGDINLTWGVGALADASCKFIITG